MTDAHVHIGWFVDRYHSPDDVTVMLRNAGVDTIAVSSTSTCAEEYDLVIHEMSWLQEEWADNCYPFLWVTPKMIETNALDKMLDSGVNWQGIKMHWQSHPQFFYDESLVDRVIKDSRLSHLPVLLHTGLFPECHAAVFDRLIRMNPDRQFILAHGRPNDESLALLSKYHNTFVDTAFMEVSDIASYVKSGLDKRILFGSDCPITEHFGHKDTTEYLKSRIDWLQIHFSNDISDDVLTNNFKRLYLTKAVGESQSYIESAESLERT